MIGEEDVTLSEIIAFFLRLNQVEFKMVALFDDFFAMSEVHEKMKKDIHLFGFEEVVLEARRHDDGPFAKRVLLFLTGCDLRL